MKHRSLCRWCLLPIQQDHEDITAWAVDEDQDGWFYLCKQSPYYHESGPIVTPGYWDHPPAHQPLDPLQLLAYETLKEEAHAEG